MKVVWLTNGVFVKIKAVFIYTVDFTWRTNYILLRNEPNKKSSKRKSLDEGRWRTWEEASVATAGPKRPELMALGARHQKYFNTLLNLNFL